MSWSCNTKGSIEEVTTAVTASLDRSAETYAGYGTPDGTAEAQDCRDAKRATLDALATMKLDADGYATKGYYASVSAYGSRSPGAVSMNVSVTKVAIEG